jgi:hypothetical protein
MSQIPGVLAFLGVIHAPELFAPFKAVVGVPFLPIPKCVNLLRLADF